MMHMSYIHFQIYLSINIKIKRNFMELVSWNQEFHGIKNQELFTQIRMCAHMTKYKFLQWISWRGRSSGILLKTPEF